MVERLLIRRLLDFESVDLELNPGLVVFTGPSGAGKTVLLSSILNLLGYETRAQAQLSEITLQKPDALKTEAIELDDDILVLRTIKKEKQRFFLNDQSVSKRMLKTLFSPFVSYLSVRDTKGLKSEDIIGLLDERLAVRKEFEDMLHKYRLEYERYREAKQTLKTFLENEKKADDLIAFAKFEIEKIEKISPVPGELDALLEQKKQLSTLEKLEQAADEASAILEHSEKVDRFYALVGRTNEAFIEGLMQLQNDLDEALQKRLELEATDVEALHDRIFALSELNRRYGSIEEALAYKEKKRQEVEEYERFDAKKEELRARIDTLGKILSSLADTISAERKRAALEVEKELSEYLEALKLPKVSFVFAETSLGVGGKDSVDLKLSGSGGISTLSGGEFNRLRLALMASTVRYAKKRSILILDEIDANVSGGESIAIAKMIKALSEAYQVFAISHQAHLSAIADQHVLVCKEGEKSVARVLDKEGRVQEIARIIGGESPSKEAHEFAKKLLSF